MKALNSLCAGLLLFSTLGCQAEDRDFKGVVRNIEARYHLHATHVPMMGFINLMVRVSSFGGCKGMRIAEFENVARSNIEINDLQDVIDRTLGDEWVLFVKDRDLEHSEQSLVYVRPKGNSMRMLVADYDHGELDVVRMEISPKQMSSWIHSPFQKHQKTAHAENTSEGD